MNLPPLYRRRAADLIAHFPGLHVLVVGDVMLDRFIIGRVDRISPEAPVPVVKFESVCTRPAIEALRAGSMTRRSTGPSGTRVPLIVDPKIPHLSCYAGATLITPNHHEAEAATQLRIRSDEDAREAARDFRARTGCEA